MAEAGTSAGTADGPPRIEITRGHPTDEELAALVGVLFSRANGTTEVGPAPAPARWSVSARPGYAYRDRRPSRPSADAWRASALPC